MRKGSTLNGRILRGNLAPGGAVSKITGKEGLHFKGTCRVFDGEEPFMKAIETGSIKKGEKTVVVLRYLGPQGGPGESCLAYLFPADMRYARDAQAYEFDYGCRSWL